MKKSLKLGALILGAVVSAAVTANAVPARSRPDIAQTGRADSQASSKKFVQIMTELDSAGSSQHETNFGDLIADSVRDTGRAEIVIVPADEIQETEIPAGSVPVTTIVDALRYAGDDSDTVVVLELTGAQLMEALERGVSRAPKPFDGFLQVSGLRVRYAVSEPDGKLVTAIGPDGKPLDPARAYRVATTSPMANGGLGYFKIWDKKAIVSETNTSIAKCVETYVTGLKSVNSVVEGRIEAH